MVAAAKHIADFRQAVVSQLFGQRHGNLTRTSDRARTTLGQQVGNLDLVILGDSALNVIHRDQFVLQRQQVFQGFANQLDGDIAAHEVRVGDHALERAFQLTDVGTNTLGNKERRIVGQIDFGLVGLFHQDRYTGFQLRRFDGNRQPPAKAGFQAFFKAFNLFRVAVTGENDLLATFEQGVEGVEKLFLGAFLAGKELDVIDQQRIHRTVEALELVDCIQLQRLDHVGHKTLRMQVHNLGIRVLL